MSTLIVYLPDGAPGASTEWAYLLTPDGRTVLQQGVATAALLPQPTRPVEVVAVVPLHQLSWQPVELPRGTGPGSARLQAVLEGLLEERLLDEPNQLHLALGPAPEAGRPQWVAVCNRAWLGAALQALEAAGRSVTRIVPELWPTAHAEANPVLRAVQAANPDEQGPRWVLTGLDASSPVISWPLLGLVDSPQPVLPALPEGTRLCAEPALAQQAEAALGQAVTLEPPATRWLEAAAGPWEMAQQSFASSQRNRLTRQGVRALQAVWQAPAWRPLRWGVAALLLAQLAGLNAWAWRESQNLRQREADIRQTLTRTFPSVTVVVDAPVQMAREVSALRQAAGQAAGNDFETLMGAIALALPPGRQASHIDYANGELRLRGLNLSAEETEQTRERLRQRGYGGQPEGEQWIVRQEARP